MGTTPTTPTTTTTTTTLPAAPAAPAGPRPLTTLLSGMNEVQLRPSREREGREIVLVHKWEMPFVDCNIFEPKQWQPDKCQNCSLKKKKHSPEALANFVKKQETKDVPKRRVSKPTYFCQICGKTTRSSKKKHEQGGTHKKALEIKNKAPSIHVLASL